MAGTGRFFNRFRVVLDGGLTMGNLVDKAAQAHPDSVLFELDEPLPYGGFPMTSLRTRDLHRLVLRLAATLLKLGLRRHDRVGVFRSNSPEIVFWSLAVIRAGGIAVPINSGMELDSLSRYLEYTGCRFLAADKESLPPEVAQEMDFPSIERILYPRLDQPSGRNVSLEALLEPAPAHLPVPVLHGDSEVLLVHTSGTTGFPKAVICTSGSLITAIKRNFCAQPVLRSFRSMSAAPFNHFVSHFVLFCSILGNVRLWTVSRFDPERVLRTLHAERMDVFFAFSNSFPKLLDAGLDRYDLSSVRLWISGADSSHESHIREFVKRGAFLRLFGRRVIGSIYLDSLGSSEVGFAALTRFATASSKDYQRYIGKPSFWGPRIRVADEDGKELPAGTPGRLMVKGPTLFKGYWNAHDRLLGVMGDGWWWTGDIVHREPGNRYYHLDRHVDIIPSAKGDIHSLPIEEVLLKRAEVREAVVIAVRDPRGGQCAIALVVPMPGAFPDPDTLLRETNGRLRPPMELRAVILVDQERIPIGLTGKVLKRLLRERYGDVLLEPGNAGFPPARPTGIVVG